MTDIGRQFLEMSRYENMGQSDCMKGLPPPAIELEYDRSVPTISLPVPGNCPLVTDSLRCVIDQRRTLRAYLKEPLTLEELSYLLWCTQGVQKVVRESHATLRTVPSAGARHAFETYLLVNNVVGLAPGLYRFLAIEHKLLTVNTKPGIADQIVEGCQRQMFVKDCAVLFIWVAVTERMNWRYNQRGYRYMFLDAGHVCQNLYLSAESIGCGCCAIAAFSDDGMNRVMGIDSASRFVIYMGSVGKKA